MRKLNEIRKGLELSTDQLPIVIEAYNRSVHELIAEKAREDLERRTKRIPLRIRSERGLDEAVKILPGQRAEIIERPQFNWFRPEDIAIHGNRERWLVRDIKIGNRSQIHGSREPIPGAEFGPGGVLEKMRLDVVQTAMDFAMVVEYVGTEPEGEVFEATVVGTALEF